MEEELKCPLCKNLFEEAVIFPCSHCFCLNCALQLQEAATIRGHSSQTTTGPANNYNVALNGNSHNESSSSAEASNCSCSSSNGPSSSASSEISDPDKVSLLSETDSGVICSSSSRPQSYVGTPNIQGVLFPSGLFHLNANAISFSITCPVCHKQVHLDANGAHSLPRCRTIEHIVEKFVDAKNVASLCQLCEDSATEATVMCEQCEVFYCESCRERCHPSRGPLAKHTLVKPNVGKMRRRLSVAPSTDSGAKCPEHGNLLTSLCLVCKLAICNACVAEKVHENHEVHSLGVLCKTQKVRSA